MTTLVNNFRNHLLGLLSVFIFTTKICIASDLPIPIDSRIKVFVYMPNSIFNIVFIPGYQSVIEFGPEEEVSIVAFGDSTGWDIKPIDNRLFIKPTEYGLKTNMQIFTSKGRSYWFEVKSGDPSDVIDDKFAYSVKFFYPDINTNIPLKKKDKIELNSQLRLSASSNRNQQFNINSIPVPKDETISTNKNFNFKYYYAGSGRNMPLKVFDDGKSTYFEFKNKAKIPLIYSVDENGNQELLAVQIQGDFIVVRNLKNQFYLKDEENSICIFNSEFLTNTGIID